jgi:uncharacterized protein YukE
MFLKTLLIAALFMTSTVGLATTEEISQKAGETADAFKKTMNEKLATLKTQIDKLEKDAKSSSGKAKVSVDDQLKSLEARRGTLKKQLDETGGQTGRAWTQVKDGMSRAMKDLESGYRNAKAEIHAKTGHKEE